jgi:hypothetical protein
MKAKVQLRENVLSEVKPARVFDAFAGLGKMFESVWSRADSYLGCDSRDWLPSEPHRRMICDNRIALRALDLSTFNVFDIDAYGQPWEQMLIIAHRRRWATGEVGAVVTTDGSTRKNAFGAPSIATNQLLGVSNLQTPRNHASADKIADMCAAKWLELSGVRQLKRWQATGRGSGIGGQKMTYTAIVFRGI